MFLLNILICVAFITQNTPERYKLLRNFLAVTSIMQLLPYEPMSQYQDMHKHHAVNSVDSGSSMQHIRASHKHGLDINSVKIDFTRLRKTIESVLEFHYFPLSYQSTTCYFAFVTFPL